MSLMLSLLNKRQILENKSGADSLSEVSFITRRLRCHWCKTERLLAGEAAQCVDTGACGCYRCGAALFLLPSGVRSEAAFPSWADVVQVVGLWSYKMSTQRRHVSVLVTKLATRGPLREFHLTLESGFFFSQWTLFFSSLETHLGTNMGEVTSPSLWPFSSSNHVRSCCSPYKLSLGCRFDFTVLGAPTFYYFPGNTGTLGQVVFR